MYVGDFRNWEQEIFLQNDLELCRNQFAIISSQIVIGQSNFFSSTSQSYRHCSKNHLHWLQARSLQLLWTLIISVKYVMWRNHSSIFYLYQEDGFFWFIEPR